MACPPCQVQDFVLAQDGIMGRSLAWLKMVEKSFSRLNGCQRFSQSTVKRFAEIGTHHGLPRKGTIDGCGSKWKT